MINVYTTYIMIVSIKTKITIVMYNMIHALKQSVRNSSYQSQVTMSSIDSIA